MILATANPAFTILPQTLSACLLWLSLPLPAALTAGGIAQSEFSQ